MVTTHDETKQGSPFFKLLATFGVVTVILFLAGLATGTQTTTQDWILYLVGGGIVVWLYLYFADKPIWRVGTREVVMMAIGAALYGIFSWVTNIVPIPAVSFVSLRLAVVLPAFFGMAFGPVVGFFTGAVGNILGDALSGWFSPVWDLGNGLMGMIPGLIWAFKDRRKATDTLLITIAIILGLFSLLAFLFPATATDGGVPAGQVGPVLLVILAGIVLLTRFVLRNQPDLAAGTVWSAFGVIVGIGFASIADIWVNGYTVAVAILGEFLPAAGTNLIFVSLLSPILLAAWQSARSQSGR